MLLHFILSYLLVNSFYLLTEGSKTLELSIIKVEVEVEVLRLHQVLLRRDGNTIKADQYLIRAEQDVFKTDMEKVLADQSTIQYDTLRIKDGVRRSKGSQHKVVSDLELIKADQELIKALILDISKAQEKLESFLANVTAALSTAQVKQPCSICKNGTHEVLIPSYSNESFSVPCDAKTRGGNWLILLRRMDGSENFNRTWKEYKNGFGSHDGEFFLGLDKIHALTSNRSQELLVELEDFEGAKKYEKYESFAIANETDFYKLTTLGAASGDAGDALRYHVGMNFSTPDQDNDDSINHCAASRSAAWWYKSCHQSNLMGIYNGTMFGRGINWAKFRGDEYSLKRAVMMIRSINNK